MRIVGVDAVKTGRPDCLLLLAWNFEREIRALPGRRLRGDFIVPVPAARLVKEIKG